MKKNIFLLSAVFSSIIFTFSATAQTMPKDADPALWRQALKLHKSSIIVDGHNDIPTPMAEEDYDLATPTVGKFHKDGDPFPFRATSPIWRLNRVFSRVSKVGWDKPCPTGLAYRKN